MENIYRKGCIKVNFSEGLSIFDDHYGYPEIDSHEPYNGPTGKVKDIQGIQAHAGFNFFVPEGKNFRFDIDECPELHIAIKAEKGTNTCLILCVGDKEPREHIRRYVVIGKTFEGNPRLCNLIKDCFEIKDDGEWHEYTFDLRKIREKQDDGYPYYPNANSVCMIQFYSWTGSEEHTFYFNNLSSVAASTFIVHGKVHNNDDKPISGLTVKAFDRNVGVDDSLLGQAVTDKQGNYSISYDSGRLSGKTSADLVLSVYQKNKLLQESGVIFDAKPVEVRDFIVTVDKISEFQHMNNTMLLSPKEAVSTVKQKSIEKRITTLNSILKPEHHEVLNYSIQAANGDWAIASATLKDILPPEDLQKLNIADLVATAVGDQPKVVAAILSTPDIKTLQDVASLNAGKLTELIAQGAEPETEAYQKAVIQAKAINNQSFAREPLAVLHRMINENELPIAEEKVRAGLDTFLQRIPQDVNIRITPIFKVLNEEALKDIPVEQQPAVVDQAKALWRTMAITPPDAPDALTVLMKTNCTSAFHVGEMPESTFLKVFSGSMGKEIARKVYTNAINTRIRNEHALITIREAIRGTGMAAIDGTKTREQLFAEVKQITETNDTQLDLDNLFGDMDYCECKECQSVYSASSYFVELLNFLRNNNLGPDPSIGVQNPNSQLDLKDISNTPLEKLFRRRPDLGDLELTCENTNTVLPYIDLVNEVMESFVVHCSYYAADTHDPKQAKLDVFNITDETTEELLAQPQHTNYGAYCILKNEAVYPFTLPFHQPIEDARIFLNYLGTSRYEMLDSFRAVHEYQMNLSKRQMPFSDTCVSNKQNNRFIQPKEQSDPLPLSHVNLVRKGLHDEILNRAVDAEFLGLTQEEYIILTKEAFWPKKYFDTLQKTTFTDDQYQRIIGVKQVYQYYGYDTEAALSDTNEDPKTGQTGLRFVKKAFLPRTGILYTDLVELLKTKFINPDYPQGLALAILENVKSSYRYLQMLVNTSSTDPKIRFGKLIAVLSSEYSWASIPQVENAGRKITTLSGVVNYENPILRKWVYDYFEKLGKLIVLESGTGPKLRVTGSFYKTDTSMVAVFSPILIGTLQNNGTIFDPDGNQIGSVAITGQVIGLDGNPIVNNYPHFRITFRVNKLSIYHVNDQGIFGADNNQLMLWQYDTDTSNSNKDTCSLDDIRLMHLDGSSVGGKPQVPIEGNLYSGTNGKSVGVLEKFGTITDDNNTVIAHLTSTGEVIDNTGKNFANNFPPRNCLTIMDDKDNPIGWVTAGGLLGPHEELLGWLPSGLDEYDRMHRFIRLWRKLGWTIDEVDKALEGLATKTNKSGQLVRKKITPHVDLNKIGDTDNLLEDWVPRFDDTVNCEITPEFLHQLVAVKKLLDYTGLPLIKLLSFWADISTAGEKSLYSLLFLSHNMVRIDDVFKADDNGNYLTGSEKIADHLPVLMAAFKLKADDITTIIGSKDILTLQNVSEIYRHGLLAKALHIRVSDISDLKKLFGDPFKNADTTLKLFETWRKMEDAGFTFRQLTYIIKNLDDPLKPIAPSQKTILQTAKTLYDGLNAIDNDNQDVTDIGQATTELVSKTAGKVFEQQVADQIVSLLEGTSVYITRAPSGLTIKIPVPQPTWASKLNYSDPKDGNDTTIQVTGILTEDEESNVIELFPGNTEWENAIKRVRKQGQSFFSDSLGSILPDTDTVDDDINGLHPLKGDKADSAPKKRLFFLHYYLPYLRQQMARRFITDTMSGIFGIAGDVTNVLLLNVLTTTRIPSRIPSHSAMSVLETIRASLTQNGNSWTGYLIPPMDNNYVFVASAPDKTDPYTAPSPLIIQGFTDPVKFKNQQVDPNNIWSTDPVSLKGGMLYAITIPNSDVSKLKWKTTAMPATQIPTSALLPDVTTAGTADVFRKFSKAAVVVNGFGLSADEVRYFNDHRTDFNDLDFNEITLQCWERLAAYTTLRASMPKATTQLLDLFAWACQPDDWNSQKDNEKKLLILIGKLNDVTQWTTDRIKALIAGNHFGLQLPADFKNEVNLIRMQNAVAVADKVGVDIDRLFNWAVPGSKFWQCHQIAEDIRMALHARFDEESWDRAVQPLNNQLREMQKQALISFLLVQPDLKAWPVVDADSLFEFFLIDVQMGAERETTRMVQAIASVQLFIKRCLMGLEEKYGVPVDAIDRNRWEEWMQKYRVWEANRKVFLYPENWIRPELRDDKSPYYKELESELLQKDINTQTVEEALKNYLFKVDEVANLKVVGLFNEHNEQAFDKDGNALFDNEGKTIPTYIKLHVFARTRNAPYFFFYRYYDIVGGYWYPWEKMQVDIPSYDVDGVDEKGNKTGKIKENGTYLIPVVWNNRLLVFFPQFTKTTIPKILSGSVSSFGNLNSDKLMPAELWEIKMAWSEYRKGKWTQKQLSTEAIYRTIKPETPISSYTFFPLIITGTLPKVGIDICPKERSSTPSVPQPILLQSATLTIGDESIPIEGIDVTVTSLIDNSTIASMIYPATELSLPSTPPTKDQCRGFRVTINVSGKWGNLSPFIFSPFMVTLTFTDQDVINTEKTAIVFNYFPVIGYYPSDYNIVYPPPGDPELDSATLIIEETTGDNKNKPSKFDVSIRDRNGTEFAGVTGHGAGSEYKKEESITVPLNINKKLKKAECEGFEVRMTMDPHNDDVDFNTDTWEFNAKVNLSFGTSTLTASEWIRLVNKEPRSFTSTDPYFPPPAPEVPPPSRVPITKRFEFSGNKISVVDIPTNDPIQKLDLQGYHFHYKDVNNKEQIHSLQAKGNEENNKEIDEAPVLLYSEPFFEDPLRLSNDTDTKLAINKKQSCTFNYSNIVKLLSTLNTDNIGNLYDYYLTLYDYKDPLKTDMADIYGSYYDDEGQHHSYHELKRPYSLYHWEVGFHALTQLVDRQLTSQQFDQAIATLQYIFNPFAKPGTSTYPAGQSEDILKRCWQFPPFKEIDARNVLENLFNDLKPGEPVKSINEWRTKPFQPHAVARGRPSAYMKYVVMKYIKILIEYGDYHFRQNTMESIPLAVQCYVMAAHLYGPRGQKIPRRGKLERKQTYKSLLDKWDAFGNSMVEMEMAFPYSNQTYVNLSSADVGLANVFGSINALYFGIPDNPNMAALRDTIDDRLLKIRSCENIEGIFQQIPPFELPIDPSLLIQAAAQGLSLSNMLNDMNSPMPNYRFYYLLQKALELCNELKTLGNAFLSAKEKGDVEALSQLRAKHESSIHNLVMEVRKQQFEEAQKSLEALQQSRKGPVSRMQYHLKLIGEDLGKVPDDNTDFSELPNQIEQPVNESGLKLIQYEKEELDKANEAANWQTGIGIVETLASVFHALPTAKSHATPVGIGVAISWGFPNLANASQATARGLRIYSDHLSYQSSSASRKGGFLRQLQDRVQQANATGYEIKNIDKQILTQQIRISIAQQEITNQQKQIDNAQEVEEYLRNKYTNQELYSWMEGSIRTLYYQAYTLAYDLAKKVEKTYRFERGLTTSNVIQFGYWDASHDGLLAGERLYIGLKQLEAAYQEKRGYDYEITKPVSLRQVNPLALMELKENGICEFALPEMLFDMDHPGHYMRRIKSVSLTVPCVVGPYTSLNCTLRLLEHKFRINAFAKDQKDYLEKTDETDDRFSTVNVPISSIAVSTGQNDSGVFELNFRDERYIPFEGAGAISKWRIELPAEFRQFDYHTISDVVMHLRYTAVEGGDKLKAAATGSVQEYIINVGKLSQQEGLFVAFDLKHEFPDEWYKAAYPPAKATERLLKLNNLNDLLPVFTKGSKKVNATDIYLVTLPEIKADILPEIRADIFLLTEGSNDYTFTDAALPLATMKSFVKKDIECPINNWQLAIKDVKTKFDKIWLIIRYKMYPPN